MKKNLLTNFLKKVLLIFALSFITLCSFAQNQVIGSFPTIEGGFEVGTPGSSASITLATGVQLSNWTGAGTSTTATTNTTTVRTGTKSLEWTPSSTNRFLFSRTAPTTSISDATSYTIQFYWFKNNTGSARAITARIGSDGTTSMGAAIVIGTFGVNSVASTIWTKASVLLTTGTSAVSPKYGFTYLNNASGGGISANGLLIDDYVIYAGALDITAPDAPTSAATSSPTASSLDVSWSAPGTGVDAGGYVVVRYATDPTGQPAPNVNGIYGVGNTIGTGTVAYIGTGTSFTDASLTANTFYYYRVYVADKAFNYSTTSSDCNGFTAVPSTPTVTLASISTVAASNIDQGSTNNVIYNFSLQGTNYFTNLTGVSFPNTGTYDADDFTNFKLYSNSTNSFPSGATLLATITSPSVTSPQAFSGFTKAISNGNTTYFWITADVNSTGTAGNTIRVTPAIASGDFTFSNTPTISGSASAASGDKTIVVATASSDYFRSITTGNWTNASTWESSHDNITWITPATIAPTALATNVIIQNGHVVNANAVLSIPNTTVDAGGEITTSTTTAITPAATKTLTVNGKLTVTTNTKAIVSTTSNLSFGPNSMFTINANGGYMPPAAWDATSTAYVAGWTTVTTLTADDGTYPSTAAKLVGQPAVRWGNLIFDLPGLTMTNSKVLSGFANGAAITLNGNLTLLRTNTIVSQLFTSSGATSLTCENFNINCGNWLLNNGNYKLTINKNFRMVDSLSAAPGYSVAYLNFGNNSSKLDTLDLKGDFVQTIGTVTTTSTLGTNTAQNINFVGTTSQNATFSTFSGQLGININNPAGVNLLSNLTLYDTLRLTAGVFNIDNNNITLTTAAAPIIRDGTTTIGTITMGSASSLAFGATGFTSGAAFVIPSGTFTSNPSIANFTINRTNPITLNSQGLELSNALTLTAGQLIIGAGGLLHLNGAALVNGGGTLGGTATSDLTVSGATGGIVTIPTSSLTLRNFTINNTRSVVAAGDFSLSGLFNITANAAYNNGGEFNISNSGGTGNITISGKYITQDIQGFNSASSSISTTIPVTFNVGSTLEYGGPNQAFETLTTGLITGLPTNIIFSGTGTKAGGSISTLNPGLIKIKTGVTVDATGGASFGGSGTDLTMEGTSYLKIQGGSTQPNMTGAYALNAASTIEFSGSSATIIRASPSYGNVIVSGTNVGLSGTGTSLALQPTTTFTVKNGGTFNVQNLNGFSGGAATAVGNTNTPTIALETNSTINYNAAANQVITTGAVSITPAASNYYNLRISGSGNKTAPSGNLIVAGDITGAGTAVYVHNNGTLVTNGTAGQNYTASTPFSLYKFTNNNASGSGFTINSNVAIENEMTLGSASRINLTAGEVILKSDVNATAALTAVPSNATITYGAGKFNIQRYMPGVKAWRLLATPVDIATSPTISDAWREGAVSIGSTGFGTRITGPGAGGAGGTYGTGANNFDEYTPNASMKSYKMSNNSFVNITENDLITGKKIANDEGYFLFVRGDRGVDVTAASGTPTTLQIKGQVRTGDQTFSVDPNKYSSIGNPYPSRLDMRSVNFNSVTESFYLWNPSATGLFNVGAYENYTKVGADFLKVPGFAVMNYIESGQAFLVQNNTGSASNVVIPEASKTTGSANVSRVGVTIPTLEINLHTNDASGVDYLADGAMLNFDNAYSNGFDEKDVKKVTNTFDNVGIKSGTQNLVVERRKALVETDTIRLNISGMRTANYSFEFDPSVLSSTGLTGYLKDKYLQTETEISLSTTTSVAFTITSDAASKVADRFMIVFRGTAGPLPVRFIDIAATKNTDKTHTIKWTIANEINIARYEIERSDRGANFVSLGNTAAVQSTSYSHVDAMPLTNDNYYRVKAISTTGEIQYSAIVKLTAKATEPLATIYPNPITDNVLKIQLANQVYGKYNITITNNVGQDIEKQTINLQSNITITNIYLKTAKAGLYYANISNSAGYKNMLPFEIK